VVVTWLRLLSLSVPCADAAYRRHVDIWRNEIAKHIVNNRVDE